MAALCATTQILIAFCKQELFSEATELMQYLIDADDEDCPIKFTDQAATEKLELELEKLNLEEPDQFVDYDAWTEWEEKVIELEDKIASLSKEASIALLSVNEWWMCTKRLGEKLQEHGAFVVFHNDIAIWGRETYGYDPAYDKTIKEVATELEILPGMSHDWSKHIKIEK